MADMKELARLLRQLDDQLAVCMRCGMCQAVCPLYAETGREPDVARGKLALLDGLSRELFADPRGVAERLQRCLLCGSCAANCPSGVKVLDIFLQARAILAGYMGLSPAKKLLFRGLLARPELFDSLIEWGARLQKCFIRPVDDTLGTSCARLAPAALAGRHLKPLAPEPFHARMPCLDTQAGSSGLRVGFYVGCLIDKVFPQVAEAVLKVLAFHGVGVYLPQSQACCGMPAAAGGDLTAFRRLTAHNLELFDPDAFDVLVTACATCTATIRKIWPLLFAPGDPQRARRLRRLADKTMDIHRFLVHKIGLPKAAPSRDCGPPLEVTYHDPCHLKKSLGVADEPRRCLAANPRVRLREMAQPDACCGLGGSFSLEHYHLSAAMGARKRDQVVATGCELVTTGCPACMLQLHDMLSRAGKAIRVRHVIEIYSEACEDR